MRTVLDILFTFATTALCAFCPGGARKIAAENLALRQQLIVLNKSRKRAPNLTTADRVVLALCTLFIGPRRINKIAVVVRPATLFRFRQHLVNRKYSRLFSNKRRTKPGPIGPAEDIVRLVVELKRRNPAFGTPRIAFIVNNTLGVAIDKDVVRRILAKHYTPWFTGTDGPSWLTFFADAKDSAWSLDLFRCESIHLKTHWVLVVMDIYTRRIIGLAVKSGSVDGPALCALFARVVSGQSAPQILSTDNDPLFRYRQWQANLRILNVDEIKSVPFVPQSHPFVERLIGTIRREMLNETLFWTATDLERKLTEFATYYNEYRVHSSLNGRMPESANDDHAYTVQNVSDIRWRQHLNGRVQLPVAA